MAILVGSPADATNTQKPTQLKRRLRAQGGDEIKDNKENRFPPRVAAAPRIREFEDIYKLAVVL